MAGNKKLEDRKKIMGDLRKVINLRIFHSIQKINQYEKDVKSVIKNIENIERIKDFLAKKSSFFDVYYKKKKQNIKSQKLLMIFMQSVDDSVIDVYSDKKIEEYISKNLLDDKKKIWVIGKRLFDYLVASKKITKKQKANISFFEDYVIDKETNVIDFGGILNRVSEYSLLAFDNKDFTNIEVYYSDIKQYGNIKKTSILPMTNMLDKNKTENEDDKNKQEDNNLNLTANDEASKKYRNSELNLIYTSFLTSISSKRKFANLKFYSDLEEINDSILRFSIAANVKYIIIGFLLNVEIRKLYSLQEELKKLDENIEEINALIKAFRQKRITREMLMIAGAKFAKDKRIEEFIRKQEDDEIGGKGRENYAK